jgi:hypothetical protein
MSDSHLRNKTFHNELLRSIPIGFIETLTTTIVILIAVKHFKLSDHEKALLIASTSMGLISSLFAVPILLRFKASLAKTAAKVQWLSGLSFLTSFIFSQHSEIYLFSICSGLIFFGIQVPLLTQIYRLNYPCHERGKLFSIAGTVRAITAAISAWMCGWILENNLNHYPWLLLLLAFCTFLSAALTYDLPVKNWQLTTLESPHFFSALSWIQKDLSFRYLLISYMLMGLGNLIATSVMVDYIANPKYSFNLSPAKVSFIVGVIPLIFRISLTYFWGKIFDRIGLYQMRFILNLFFAAQIFLFFNSSQEWVLMLAMASAGIASAGGVIIWGLWVTKIAPANAVAEYMSVHAFLTGLRGVAAPFIAYQMLQYISFSQLAWFCTLLVLSSNLFLGVQVLNNRGELETQ